MAWTTPKTWTSEPLISGDLNTEVRDNLIYLKEALDNSAPAKQYIRTSGNYTTTSTSFVDMDDTNLNITLITTGRDVRVTFTGYGMVAGAAGELTLGVRVDGTHYTILKTEEGGSGGIISVSFSYIFAGLSAGEHDFKMRWLTSDGTGTIYAGKLLFDVREELGAA